MNINNRPLGGVVRGVCYSGFREGQHPDRGSGAVNPSYEQTLEDLRIIAKSDFGIIRVYDSGSNSRMVLSIIREERLPLQVMLGIWLKAEISNHETCEWLNDPIPESELIANAKSNQDEIQRGIALAKQFEDVVIAVNVGNEILVDWNDHGVNLEATIEYVKQVQEAIAQPVTVAENVQWWVEFGQALASIVDFLAVHSYPVWIGANIKAAMSITKAEMEMAFEVFPNRQIILAEAGWATVSREFGERAGEPQQKRYFTELMSWAEQTGTTVLFFEAFDEPWKGGAGDSDGAEKHWGLFDESRKPKLAMG
jgi:exo-beta-1,3-glucanase (GH17 family)